MGKTLRIVLGVVLLMLSLTACAPSRPPAPSTPEEAVSVPSFTLTSTAFSQGGEIPARYTCKGQDLSPPLSWSDVPEGTKSLVLICDDPDAPRGTFVHWVVYNIPPSASRLPEGIPAEPSLEDGTLQGINHFGKIGYGGPCPPPGPAHRYFFKLYALDTTLELPPGATKEQVLKAMEGHILAKAELVGTFGTR